jgi:DNA-binding transcriptional LysR family regulator
VLEEIRDGKNRELIVASSQTLANTILARAVTRFRKTRPQINVSIQSMATAQVIDRLERREADIGLVYGLNLPGMVQFEPLIPSAIVCAFPAKHPLSAKKTISTTDLKRESIISVGQTTIVRRTIETACKEARIEPPRVNIEASSAFAGCLMVSEGAGVALIDESTFLSDFFRPLIFRPFEPACAVDLALVLPLNRRVSAPARDLAAILSQLAAEKVTQGR